jgi:flavodoxin
MMHNSLFLQRLRIVTHSGEVAYDEQFHRGVNIIRGQNSSGKSTIVRFIFFVLGGCYTDFVPQAMKCRSVMAEVCINGSVITIKRYLERKDESKVNGYAPMYVHFGPMEEVVSGSMFQVPGMWQKYPYVTTDKTHSFSNVLFRMLGYPEVKADSNITMHQILRLIYLDQESPVNSLFFYDQFDKEIYRETVANLLLGLYDQRYSEAKQELQNTVKAIAEVKVSIKNVGEFLKGQNSRSSRYFRDYIDRLNKEIEEIRLKVMELRTKKGTDAKEAKVEPEYQRILEDITRQRKACDGLEREIKELENEIGDTQYFIEALNKRKEAVDRSIATRDYFDTIHLDFCPECLTEIAHKVEEGHCPLCKSPIDNSKGKSQALRIRLELEFQIKESTSIKEENEQALDEKKAQLRRMRRQLRATQRHYDDAVGFVRSTQEEHIDQLLQDKGFKEGEILQYRTLLEQAEKYEKLLNEEDYLKAKEAELRRYIEATENRIKFERKAIDDAVSNCGVFLLREDEGRQDEFMNAKEFGVDYNQTMTYISNQRIKLSASSAFYLKMVARFAILFASLKVDSMMYPRLLFSDNMEDKGLEPERAVKFQKTIVRLLEQVPEDEYQVIFATSYIVDELNVPKYTVGDYYTSEKKSLKNV